MKTMKKNKTKQNPKESKLTKLSLSDVANVSGGYTYRLKDVLVSSYQTH